MSCQCRPPNPSTTPNANGDCLECGRIIAGDWVTTDEKLSAWFERLVEGFPDGAPDWFSRFRAQCEARERAGQDKFKFRYTARDNCAEATEEAADGVLYCYLEGLRLQRDGDYDPDVILDLLTAAHHFALAHKAIQTARSRRLGSPIAAMSE
jgi:hypothetical protein